MLSTITYRAGLNRNGYVNGEGLRLVVITIYSPLTRERVTVNTHIRVRASDFRFGKVQPTDPNHDIYNRKIARRIRRLMEYEDEMEASSITPSPRKIREAWKNRVSKSATIGELVESIIVPSAERKASTVDGYRNLAKSMEDFRPGTRLSDLDHDTIERYRSWMKAKGLSENTAIGRLKLLHALTQECIKRNLLSMDQDPFRFIQIGNMRPKVAWLSMQEINRIEKVRVEGKLEKVRDLWLLGFYSGLRYGDLTTLEEAEIRNGILRKMMHKTEHEVVVPLKTLFWGRGLEIIRKYPDITVLSHCVSCNSTANRMIKEVARKAGVKKVVTFHIARKSTASNLAILGMPVQDIASILGHSKTEVTSKHYLFSKELAMVKASEKLFKARASRNRREGQAPPTQDTQEPSRCQDGEDPG